MNYDPYGGRRGADPRDSRDSREPTRDSRGHAQGHPQAHGSSAAGGTPNFRWWIPAEGIRRDVIQADIQRYLGPEALVRTGEGRDADRGRNGYWIAAYRTLTPAMVQDLKADSANFERSGDTGRYENSIVHRSRQHWGPTGEQQSSTPVSSSATDSPYSRDSRTTASSGYGDAPYGGSSNAQFEGYDPQYATRAPDRRPDAGYRAPADPRDQYSGYAGSVSTGYGGGAASIGTDYTYGQPQHQNANQPSHYGHAQDPYRVAPDPRSAQQPYSTSQAGSHSGYSASTSHLSSNIPPAAQRAPPGYYLASDGKYYPESSRPT